MCFLSLSKKKNKPEFFLEINRCIENKRLQEPSLNVYLVAIGFLCFVVFFFPGASALRMMA